MNHARARRILVADDADSITMLLSVALGAEGYKVVTAEDGVAAFELGCEHRIDMAIIDHLMPGLLGMEVLEKWRSEGLDFPVMMLSGIDDESVVVECLRHGATDYMRKPFRVAELTARVALALGRSAQ